MWSPRELSRSFTVSLYVIFFFFFFLFSPSFLTQNTFHIYVIDFSLLIHHTNFSRSHCPRVRFAAFDVRFFFVDYLWYFIGFVVCVFFFSFKTSLKIAIFILGWKRKPHRNRNGWNSFWFFFCFLIWFAVSICTRFFFFPHPKNTVTVFIFVFFFFFRSFVGLFFCMFRAQIALDFPSWSKRARDRHYRTRYEMKLTESIWFVDYCCCCRS